MEWRPSRILTICVMVLAVNYLITDHRCSILRHDQLTFQVTNATILSATLHQQWSFGTVYSCLVDVQYTPMLTQSAAAAAATAATSSSSSRSSSSPTDDTSNNAPSSPSSSSPPMDPQSWPPTTPVRHMRHTTAPRTNAASQSSSLSSSSSSSSESLVQGQQQKVWVELACPSASFCQRHCQATPTGSGAGATGEQLWYDPSSAAVTRRLSWIAPDADSCYGFIMGVTIAIGICTMGIIADWMVDRKCPARTHHYSTNDLAALLASHSSSRGYPGYGGMASTNGSGHTLGYGSTSSLYRGNHSNIHGYSSAA
jgi:hypothetical protein